MTPIRLQVKELRQVKGMSQGDLAAKAKIRQATLSAIEAGETTRIDFAVLEALADALGVEPALLIARESSKRGK